MFFTYWTIGSPPFDFPIPANTVSAWHSAGHSLAVSGAEAVEAALEAHGPWAAHLFRSIRIPACRSDLARLVLLHRHGGIYVDAHCAPGAALALARLMEWQRRHALILFDESLNLPAYRNTCIINGVMAGQAGSRVLDNLIKQALRRLKRHYQSERQAAGRHLRYNIYMLTGPWMIWHALYRRSDVGGADLAPHAKDVAIWPFEPEESKRAVIISQFNDYKRAGAHWSERQTLEPLFDRSDASALS